MFCCSNQQMKMISSDTAAKQPALILHTGAVLGVKQVDVSKSDPTTHFDPT